MTGASEVVEQVYLTPTEPDQSQKYDRSYFDVRAEPCKVT